MFGLEDGAAQTKDGTAATLSDLGPSSLRPRLRPDRRGSRKALDQRGLIQPEVRSSTHFSWIVSRDTTLGLHVVIDDCVHSSVRVAAIIAVRLGCYGLAVVSIIATLYIAFGG